MRKMAKRTWAQHVGSGWYRSWGPSAMFFIFNSKPWSQPIIACYPSRVTPFFIKMLEIVELDCNGHIQSRLLGNMLFVCRSWNLIEVYVTPHGIGAGKWHCVYYSDVIMRAMASQIISVLIVYSTVCSGADQRKYQSSASLIFCEGNPPVTSEFATQKTSNAENASI